MICVLGIILSAVFHSFLYNRCDCDSIVFVSGSRIRERHTPSRGKRRSCDVRRSSSIGVVPVLRLRQAIICYSWHADTSAHDPVHHGCAPEYISVSFSTSRTRDSGYGHSYAPEYRDNTLPRYCLRFFLALDEEHPCEAKGVDRHTRRRRHLSLFAFRARIRRKWTESGCGAFEGVPLLRSWDHSQVLRRK